MASEIVLPQWGMEMQEGTVVKWLKQEGEPVEEGEPLVEIETAKLETELESTASGIVAHILVPEGETVQIRTLLAIIAAPGEEVPRPTGKRAAAPRQVTASAVASPQVAPTHDSRQVAPQIVPAARHLAQQKGIDLGQLQGTGPRGRILVEDVERLMGQTPAPTAPQGAVQVVPAARRLAREKGVDLNRVKGSGPKGRVLIRDIEEAVHAQASRTATVLPITGMRQTIATRMLQSTLSMAQVTLTTEADVTDAMNLRQGLARLWSGGGLSPLHLVIKATARSLREHPQMNAIQSEDEVQLAQDVNLGVAVSLPEGLIVPVIRRADHKNLAEIANESRDLANNAREGKASYDEVTGGTFTITNLGAYDIDAFTPIINPPQVGILGVGRVIEKPAVHQGEIVRRSLMFLSLTFDHRVIDGAPAAEFLRTIKAHLEDPWWMVASF